MYIDALCKVAPQSTTYISLNLITSAIINSGKTKVMLIMSVIQFNAHKIS